VSDAPTFVVNSAPQLTATCRVYKLTTLIPIASRAPPENRPVFEDSGREPASQPAQFVTTITKLMFALIFNAETQRRGV
jgi:hypothetical protein